MPGINRFLNSPVRGSSGSATGRGSSPLNGFNGLGTEELPVIDPILQAASRKRPAEDMTQYAEAAARNVRLKPDAKAELLKFAEVSGWYFTEQKLMCFPGLRSRARHLAGSPATGAGGTT